MSTLSISPAFVPELDLAPRRTARTAGRPAAQPAVRPAATTAVRPTGSSVRLTRRGRLVVFLAALAIVLVGGVFLGAGSVATGEAGTPQPTEIVMVEPGDTLWGIAAEAGGDDIRATIAEIERLNALDSVALSAGQKLRVPLAD